MGNRRSSRNLLRAVAATLIACACTLAQSPPEDATAQRRLLEAMPIAEPVADGEVITVVDGVTGEPVANADVVVMPYPRDRAARAALEKTFREIAETAKDVETMQWTIVSRYGTRYRTDADGVARVATLADHQVSAMVSAGGRTGSGSIGTIKIWNTVFVAVEVLDANGRPAAGVPVGLHEVGYHFGARSWPTDAQGVARLVLDNHCRARKVRMVARAEIAHEQVVEAEFDAFAPPETPLRLQLPALGKVRFVLYGPDERPLRELRQATLKLADEDPAMARRASVPPARLDADGAHFDHVAPGHEVVVAATLEGSSSPLTFRGKGPARAGEVVVIEGRTNTAAPVITLRVLRPDGTPLTRTRVGTVLRFATGHHSNTVETDAEARLRMTIPNGAQQLYVLQRDDAELTTGLGSACIDVDQLPGGLQDVGDLRIEAEPVCARGRLVDGDGKPVAGVLVTAKMSTTAGSGGGSRNGQHDPFEHRVLTDAGGRFELRELRPFGETLEVTVKHDTLVAEQERLQLELGGAARDHTLVRCGRLHGTFEPGLGEVSPDLRLVSRSNGLTRMLRTRDGSFGRDHLPPGVYDLILDRHSGYRIDGLVVPAGGEVTDERLSPVRWQQHLQVVQVDVTDDAGKPVADAMVWAMVQRADGGGGGGGERTDANGRARLLTARANCTITVERDGFAVFEGAAPQATMPIRMQRLAAVELQVIGLPELPKGVGAAVTAIAADRAPAKAGSRVWGGHRHQQLRDGAASLLPDRTGKWTATLSFSVANLYRLDRDTQQAVQRALRIELPSAEFEAGSEAKEPLRIELDADTRALLAERMVEVKDLLEAAAKANADAARK